MPCHVLGIRPVSSARCTSRAPRGATNAHGPTSLPSPHKAEQRLQLCAGASMIPHPAKADRGGEDAYFIDERSCCAGVAGVCVRGGGGGGSGAAARDALPGGRRQALATLSRDDCVIINSGDAHSAAADGVGGWAEIGVDPGLYSRELMKFAKEATSTCDVGPSAPQQLLEVAYLATTARGSSTACIVCLENERLHASNLGDSGAAAVA